MGPDPVEREVRAATNESLFRKVNEQLERLAQAFHFMSEQGASFVCECANPLCIQRMSLTITEYEAGRAAPNRFMVLPGHVDDDVERVVSENERFLIVEKVGVAATVAAEADPRSTR